MLLFCQPAFRLMSQLSWLTASGKFFRRYPEVTNVVSQVGTPDDGTDPNNYSNIEIFVDLAPREKWRPQFHDKQDLVYDMNRQVRDEYPGVLYNFLAIY